jgi:hypothetical protein
MCNDTPFVGDEVKVSVEVFRFPAPTVDMYPSASAECARGEHAVSIKTCTVHRDTHRHDEALYRCLACSSWQLHGAVQRVKLPLPASGYISREGGALLLQHFRNMYNKARKCVMGPRGEWGMLPGEDLCGAQHLLPPRHQGL